MDNYNEKTEKSDTTVKTDINGNHINNQIMKRFKSEKKLTETDAKLHSTGYTFFGYKASQLKWINIFWLTLLHSLAIYAYIYAIFVPAKLQTVLFSIVVAIHSGFGASVGAHRLFAHRSFKARFLLKLLLVTFETMAINGGVFSYARDHRNHHKFVDTDADPKNARRGFLFAHIGWWCVKKNPDVISYGKKLSLQDLLEDRLVMFQYKLYYPLVILLGIIFPTLTPYFLWNENLLTSFLLCFVLRTVFVMHHLFTVNSIAHIIGTRPYDKNIGPTESRITMYLSFGEGSHNYHHTFSMDYANCEKKWWEVFNPSTLFIDACALLGLAYDLKKPSKEAVQGVIRRKGIPEYFQSQTEQSLSQRIAFGALDWLIGLNVAFWMIWSIIFFKLIIGVELFVF